MELVRLRGKGQLTLPDEVRKAVRHAEGDYLAVSVRDGVILLEPKTIVDASQSWFWTDAWQQGEREASAEMAAGRGTTFDSAEEFLASLE